MTDKIENTNTLKQKPGDITPGQGGDISSSGGINQERMDLYGQLGKLPQEVGSGNTGLPHVDLKLFEDSGVKVDGLDKYGKSTLNKSEELSNNTPDIDPGFDVSNDPGRITPFIDHGFDISNAPGRNTPYVNDGFSVSEIIKQVPRPGTIQSDK